MIEFLLSTDLAMPNFGPAIKSIQTTVKGDFK